jgi:hypothetical protein
MNQLPGAAGQATKGIGELNQALNVLKANPIIAVIALIVGYYSYSV